MSTFLDVFRKLEALERQSRTAAKRRRSAGSQSSDSDSQRKRSKSSSSPRPRARGSKSNRRGRSPGSVTSNPGRRKEGGDAVEKLLVQIHDSIGMLSDNLEKVR